MSFEDFLHYFSRLELCHLGPESVAINPKTTVAISRTRRWEMTREEGEWLRNSTAGGCPNFQSTFYMNPQFRVEVVDVDESYDGNYGTIVIGLMQKGMREQHKDLFVIGYSIYKLPLDYPNDQLLDKVFFRSYSSVGRSDFTNMREVCGRHKLKPAHYVIVPATYNPNEEAKFVLRIFSERKCSSNELDDATKLTGSTISIQSNKSADEELIAKLEAAFMKIARPPGVITYFELKDILDAAFTKDFPFEGFSKETARSMVALMDADLSGSLEFSEFKKLWMELRLWKTIFKKFDRRSDGTLDAFELRTVLKTMGIHVSNTIFKAINCRYADGKGRILFDDYILLLVRLVTVFETFKAQRRLDDGSAVFEADHFIRSVIYI